jgi:hypothetical protein
MTSDDKFKMSKAKDKIELATKEYIRPTGP